MKKDIRDMIDAMEKLMNSMQELIYNYYAKCEPVSAKDVKIVNLDASNITVEKNSNSIKELAIEKSKPSKEQANKKAKLYEFEGVHWFTAARCDGGVSISTHSNTSIFVGDFVNGAYLKINKNLYIVEDGELKFLAEV